jgi:hypothetical protein
MSAGSLFFLNIFLTISKVATPMALAASSMAKLDWKLCCYIRVSPEFKLRETPAGLSGIDLRC